MTKGIVTKSGESFFDHGIHRFTRICVEITPFFIILVLVYFFGKGISGPDSLNFRQAVQHRHTSL